MKQASTAQPMLGGLRRRELSQLEELAGRDARTLSEDELAMLDGLARWGLFMDDDGDLPEFCGAGICACDGPCTNERDDLSDEQSDLLHRIRAVALREKRRRLDLREALRQRLADERCAPQLHRRVVDRLAVRPRTGRARRLVVRVARRQRRLSLSRSTADDPEPARRALARPEFAPGEAAP
jgi:hypothetical protein